MAPQVLKKTLSHWQILQTHTVRFILRLKDLGLYNSMVRG